MDSEGVETRVIGGVRLTGAPRLLDKIRTATEADLDPDPDAAPCALLSARELVPPPLARWMREGATAPGLAEAV
jgi:hypothetical protein